MSPDAADEKPASPRRRRSSRGRGGAKSADNGSGQSSRSLDDPRVVGRRPASSAKPDTDGKSAEPGEAKPTAASRSRSRGRGRGSPSSSGSSSGGSSSSGRSSDAGSSSAREGSDDQSADGATAVALGPAPVTASVDGTLATLAEQVQTLQAAVRGLSDQLNQTTITQRLGVFVDVPNVIYGAERDEGPSGPIGAIDMGKLLDYLTGGRNLVRATAYAPVSDDPHEPVEQQRFVAPFVPHAYRIVTKPLKRFADGSIKGNFDVELAVDMVTMAERLDVLTLVSGDADLARAVELVQGRGVRVEVAAFSGSTAVELRAIADRYIELGEIADQLRP